MKKVIITISLIIFVLSSCDRSGVFEEFDHATPYEYHVIAVSDDNNVVHVGGATIFIYKEKEDRDNNKNLMLQKNAGNDGKAIFQPEELQKEKGFFYLGLEKVVSPELHLSQSADSRYLLINDGQTHQWVKLTETMVKIIVTDTDFADGGIVRFFANKEDRDQKNLAAAMPGLTKTISGNEIVYKKLPVDDLKEAYRTTPYILLEKTDANGTIWTQIDPTVIYGSKTYTVVK